MSAETIKKFCPFCLDEIERDDFAKCQFCDDCMTCKDCMKEHFTELHYNPRPISDEEFEALEEATV